MSGIINRDLFSLNVISGTGVPCGAGVLSLCLYFLSSCDVGNKMFL